MSDLTPDEAAAARTVRATVDALSAAQPPVTDWPGGVRKLLARRRSRRAAVATAGTLVVAVLVVGTAAAVSGGTDELVAGPAPQVSASAAATTAPAASPPAPGRGVTTPTTRTARTTPTQTPAVAAPAPAASPTPQPPSPSQRLPACGAAPAPTDGDVVLELRFPERVNPSTAGILRVTNRGSEPIAVNLRDDEAAFAVRDGRIVSTGASNSMGQAPTTLAPGEHREVRVRVLAYLCDGNFERRLPEGSYEVQSMIRLNQAEQAVSPAVTVTFEPN